MQNQKNSGSSKMGADFACGPATRGPMDKWSLQAHSALKTGLDSMFQEVLTVVQSGQWGGDKSLGNWHWERGAISASGDVRTRWRDPSIWGIL